MEKGSANQSSATFHSQPAAATTSSSSVAQKSRKRGDRKVKSSTVATAAGSKKERWLLTRKTWRYMTDAVGNLLPTPPTASSTTTTIATASISSDNKSDHHTLTGRTTTSTSVGTSREVTGSTSQFKKSTVGTQSTIVCQQEQRQHEDFYTFGSFEATHDISLGERQFHNSCNNQSQFLIWARTKATRVSGPASRQLKINEREGEMGDGSGGVGYPESPGGEESINVDGGGKNDGGGGQRGIESVEVDCFSTEGDDEILNLDDEEEEMEGDEYDEYDEEQVTVREGRKSSLASSISSVISGLSFFRSPAAPSDEHHALGSSLACGENEKTFVSVGIQTDPFPEETLNRLRRQCFLQENSSDPLSKFPSTTAGSTAVGDIQGSGYPYAVTSSLHGGVPPEGHCEISNGPPSGSTSPFSALVPNSSQQQQQQQQQQLQPPPQTQQQQEKQSDDSSNTFRSSSILSVDVSENVGEGAGSGGVIPSVPSSGGGGDPDKKSEESGYSSSISDTVMRYLRMVRKNSKVDKSDMDRFKTVNYDRSLRNIKSKNVSIEEALEHEKNKQLAGQNKATSDSAASEFSCAITSSNLEKLQEYSNRMSATPKDVTSTMTDKGQRSGVVGKLPGRILPSVGIQAGESLVRFLKLFNRRKCSDFSSFCSSESPVDLPTSPRCSLATTVISSSGSDNDYFQQQPRPSPRASFDNNSQSTFDEPQEFFGESDIFSTTTSGSHFPGGGGSFYPPYPPFSSSSASSSYINSPSSSLSSYHQGVAAATAVSIGSGHGQQHHQLQQLSKYPFPSSHSSTFDHHYQVSALTNIPTSSNLSQQQQASGSSSAYNLLTSRPPSSGIIHGERKRSSFPPQARDGGKEIGVDMSSTPPPSSSSSAAVGWPTSMTGGKAGQQKLTQPAQQTTFIKSLFSSGHRKNVPSGVSRSGATGSSELVDSTGVLGLGTVVGVDNSRHATSSMMSTSVGSVATSGSEALVSSGGGGSSNSSSRSRVVDNRRDNAPRKGSSRKGQEFLGQGIGPDVGSEAHIIANVNVHPSDCLDSSSNTVMQKSKSSSSVLQQSSGYSSSGNRLISKAKLFKSKKQPTSTRQEPLKSPATTAWTPQPGKPGKWTSLLSSRQVSLEPTTLHNLTEIERVTLQKVALANLQALNLGVDVKIPREKTAATGSKPKRRPYLLKKKALSTGFFDSKRDESSGKDGGSGLVFAVSLSQCVKNDQERRQTLEANNSAIQQRVPLPPATTSSPWGEYQQQQQQKHERRKSHHSSRLSVSSDIQLKDDKGVCGSNESLSWPEKNSESFNQLFTGGSTTDISTEEESYTNYGQVPQLVLACVKHLETFGLHTTGIFRVSSSMKRIRQLREEIDSGKEIKFGEEHSPHDVAALLKEFLRDLPEPLLCRDLYEAFLRTQRIRNRRLQLESVQQLIDLLPVVNRDTLYALLSLFSKVVDNCQDKRNRTGELVSGNKMEAYSLATLIAPNILPCMPMDGNLGSGEQQAILTKERRDSIDVVNYMITNYRELFYVSPETLHQVYMELLETNPEAVEHILRSKFPAEATQEAEDVDTASSVFDGGSECGDAEEFPSSKILLRKREEILHEGGGKGGSESRSDSGRIKMEISSQSGDRSGGDSDSSSTKSTSRWFRKSKSDQKNRASSDSGSDKVKGSRKKKDSVIVGGIEESKRASSLDSVNLKDIALGRGSGGGKLVESKSSAKVTSGDRQRSSSDQGLKIPVDMSRRQSSPLLESRSLAGAVGSGGIIRASLKITMPINIDDTDIPFIEEDNSPGDQGTSSPVDDLSLTFPYQESQAIQARIYLGGIQAISSSHRGGSPKTNPTSSSSLATNVSSHETSLASSSTAAAAVGTISSQGPQLSSSHVQVSVTTQNLNVSNPGSSSSSNSSSTSPSPNPGLGQNEPKGLGKETKGANIGGLGLIKSKTADFEKLAKRSSSSGASGSAPATHKERTRKSTKDNTGLGVSEGHGGHKVKQVNVITLSKSSSDLGAASSVPASTTTTTTPAATTAAGGRWKRSEIIASPSTKKHETFL